MTLQQRVDHAVRSVLKDLMFSGMYGGRGSALDGTLTRVQRYYDTAVAELRRVSEVPLEDLPLYLASKEPTTIEHRMAAHRLSTGEAVPLPSSLHELMPSVFLTRETSAEEVISRLDGTKRLGVPVDVNKAKQLVRDHRKAFQALWTKRDTQK